VFPTLRNQKKIEKEEIEKPHPAKPPVIVPRPHNDVRRQMLPSLRRFSRKSGCRSQNETYTTNVSDPKTNLNSYSHFQVNNNQFQIPFYLFMLQ
jgi:hypothetical protein